MKINYDIKDERYKSQYLNYFYYIDALFDFENYNKKKKKKRERCR